MRLHGLLAEKVLALIHQPHLSPRHHLNQKVKEAGPRSKIIVQQMVQVPFIKHDKHIKY